MRERANRVRPDAEDVKAELRRRGSSLATVARAEGVSTQAVSRVLLGESTSARLEVALAEHSGYTMAEIRRITRRRRRRNKERAA